MIVNGPILSSLEKATGEKVQGNQIVSFKGNRKVPDVSSEESIIGTSRVKHTADIPAEAEVQTEAVEEVKSFTRDEYSKASGVSSEKFKDFGEEDYLPTEKEKCEFFKLLKGLLEDPCLLREGRKLSCQFNDDTLRLVYGSETCEVIIEDSSGSNKWKDRVKTQDMYRHWRYDEVETLSLQNLQKVQNDLKILNIQSEELKRCFSSARINFNNELERVQENTTLNIICHDVSLTFVSGKGENVANILYDDIENKPVYTIKVADWYTRIQRWLYKVLCFLMEVEAFGKVLWNSVQDFISTIFQQLLKEILSPFEKSKTE